jgi:3-phenylpropionate/trans-cinnamate dioxygenase ferredoxin reductase component
MTGRVVVIGAGLAGNQLAVSLREKGFSGDIVLLGDEGELPYQRPPLSKAFLKGMVGGDSLLFKPAGYFIERRIDFRPYGKAVSIDRASRHVHLATGEQVAYDRLVLATGARNRRADVANAEADGVFSLRTRRDAESVKARLQTARRAVVIGAGFIGMEFAAVAAQTGVDVTIIEQADRSMSRVVSQTMSAHFEARHRAAGVCFEFGATLEGFEVDAANRQTAVRPQDGRAIPADLALVAIGVVPVTELAEAAGLAARDGIVVDARLATADPAINAIGDCASYPHPLHHGRRVRLESVQNAADQARFLADAMTGGAATGGATRYESVPWFWSDQYDMKLQIAGLGSANDAIELRGGPEEGQFSVAYTRDGRLAALETVNQAREHMLARNEIKRLIASNP